jgi:hypothetical protein
MFGFRTLLFRVSLESLYANYGPQDEEPRHRSTDAAAVRNLRVTGYGPGTHEEGELSWFEFLPFNREFEQ